MKTIKYTNLEDLKNEILIAFEDESIKYDCYQEYAYELDIEDDDIENYTKDNEIIELIMQDIESSLEDIKTDSSSQYRGVTRVSDHANTCNYSNSSNKVVFNIVVE